MAIKNLAETAHPTDGLAAHRKYWRELNARMLEIDESLGAGLLVVNDIPATNQLLEAAGRSDLVIESRAQMMPVSSHQNLLQITNNFAPGWKIIAGHRETVSADRYAEPNLEAIPMTDEDFEKLKTLPKFKSVGEITDAIEAAEFPGLDLLTLTSKEAFVRTLIIAPDFVKRLVGGIGNPENGRNFERFVPELFAGYQIMSRLVDTSDLYVARDGQLDNYYLCR